MTTAAPARVAVALTVNGAPVEAAVEPRTHLADLLREELGLTGTHLGCEHGVCGACTVEIDGAPQRSCIAFAAACEGAAVRTIEGLDDDPVAAALREAFAAEHALQCGYCTPGMLVAARDIALRLPDADEAEVREALAGNLCRCTGYRGIVRAVLRVLAERRGAAPGAGAQPPVSTLTAPPPAATATRDNSAIALGLALAQTSDPVPVGSASPPIGDAARNATADAQPPPLAATVNPVSTTLAPPPVGDAPRNASAVPEQSRPAATGDPLPATSPPRPGVAAGSDSAIAQHPSLAATDGPAAAASSDRPSAAAGIARGAPVLRRSVDLAVAPARVWEALSDPALVAACVPGLELAEALPDGTVRGAFRVRLGPIGARFAGEGRVLYDEASRTAHVSGGGADTGGPSRVSGEARVRVLEPAPDRARLEIEAEHRLTGLLAQFSRGAVAQAVAARLTDEFARALERRLLAETVPTTTPTAPGRGRSAWRALLAWLRSRMRGGRA